MEFEVVQRVEQPDIADVNAKEEDPRLPKEDTEDPFDDPVAVEPKQQRDWQGRPYVVPPEGGKRKAYTRCTTFVGCLEDQYTVHQWQQRMVSIGLADRPDLLLTVAANRDDRDVLNKVVEQAREAAKANTGANTGSALHKICEDRDKGIVYPVPPAYAKDIEAYEKATKYFEMVSIEQFCVLDKWGGIGGTPDRVIKFFDRYYIGDIKTGTIEHGQLKFAMQFATYAHSIPYFWQKNPGEGMSITPSEAAELRGEWPGPIDQERAILIHLPQGEGRCDVYFVNILQGWEACTIAAAVRAWRNKKQLLTEFNYPAEMARAKLRDATTVEELYAIHKDYVAHGHDGNLILQYCKDRKWQIEHKALSEQAQKRMRRNWRG